MVKLFDRNATKLTISEFYDNYEREKYKFDTKYQRESGVWNEDRRSFLIDSILKNYPMPPVFMRPNIDSKTGKTQYDVVDGKQRLETIISFIEDRIRLTDYFWEDKIFFVDTNGANLDGIEKEMSGKRFSEIKADSKFADFVRQFWTYVINVDYLYQDDADLVANVFDRLNRGGVPLNNQELRNARFNQSYLLEEIKGLAEHTFWKLRLEKLKEERMENDEFISELFFLIAEGKLIDSSPSEVDELYKKYANIDDADIDNVVSRFMVITDFIESLKLDYDKLKKLYRTTHLYGLFSFAWYCIENKITPNDVKCKLNSLYTEYFGRNSKEPSDALKAYKESCSSKTRSKAQREKRLGAIKEFCEIQ